jgi:hypothetical protein
VPQRYEYSLLVFGDDVGILIDVIDGDGKRRRMSQHICHWCPMCANKGKTKIGC